MCHASTSAVDCNGLKRCLKIGLALAITIIALASITGCGTSRTMTPNKTVFLGDSITALWNDAGEGQQFFSQHPTWMDEGTIGQNSDQLVVRFQVSVVALHPQTVAILTGTNDVYPGWQLCGGNPVFDTCNNIKNMVAQARAAGITPILATIPPWGCTDPHCALAQAADGSQARYDRINTLNTWIKQYGFEQGLVVIDYHAALESGDDKTYQPALTIDGVHPTTAGYAIMTPMVQDAIQASVPTK